MPLEYSYMEKELFEFEGIIEATHGCSLRDDSFPLPPQSPGTCTIVMEIVTGVIVAN